MTFCPLKLSFARTIDTFQGQTAGPSQPGKPPNDVERIIIDPGDRSFEARGKLGIFFTQFSRGSTIGKLVNGKRMGSALYFHDFGLGKGGVLTASRIAKLRGPLDKPDVTYRAIRKRDKWIDHLMQNAHSCGMSEEQVNDTLTWATETRIDPQRMDKWFAKLTENCRADVP
jgi:hypothetical protein